jgi:hypothetical protein
MATPSQHAEFEAAIQHHIQQAVAAALAGILPPAAPAPPTVNVNAVAVKLPDFWPADPTTWFHQAEAAFRRSNVTVSYTKYDLVFLQDDKTKQNFLVDTGPAVSVLPHTEPAAPTDRHSPAQMGKQFHLGEASHAPFLLGCEPSFALSFSPPFQSQFLEQIFLQNTASWSIPPPVKFLMQKPSHHSDPQIRPPPPRKRRVRALPLLCVTLPRPSAISLHNFRQWSAMDPEHQSQPMVFRTPLKP